MENNYILYVGMDSSKGKADAAILKVSDRRSVKPKFLRKKLSFAKFKKNVATRLSDFLILKKLEKYTFKKKVMASVILRMIVDTEIFNIKMV